MHKKSRNGWIQTGTALAVLAALTAGTHQSPAPPVSDVSTDRQQTSISHHPARGMVAVQMHDLQGARLMGVRERIALPDRDGLLRQIGASSPGGAMMAPPPIGLPAMQLPRETGLERGLLDGLGGELPGDSSGLSWGWLADEVNAAAPPPSSEPETGGFGFSPSTGSRRYEDRNNRLGTDQGFGTGGNDAFIFQRRRDDGY